VDTSSNSVAGNITVGLGPHGISLDTTGSRAYVANEADNSVSVIDTASRTVIATVSVRTAPIAFGNSLAEPKIPSPRGANVFTPYTDAVLPFRDSDPTKAKPIGMGTIAGVGAILSLSVGANRFSSPMDVYLGLSMPAIDPANIYLFTSAGLKPISAGMSPWKTSVTDISGVVVSDYDALLLPTGKYGFYLHVVPAGTPAANLSMNYYQWSASLSVVRASDVAAKAIALFGTDLAAAVAILLAWDNGYSLDEIIAAIDAGTLSSLVVIQGTSESAPELKGMRGENMVDRWCKGLELKDPVDADLCYENIGEVMKQLELNAEGYIAQYNSMLIDVGYSRDQINKVLGAADCYRAIHSTQGFGIEHNKACYDEEPLWVEVEPQYPPNNKLTEAMDAVCSIIGDNSDSRMISENPFMSSQGASPILGFKSASSSTSCTPTCTDSDSDGYYVQSGCGTGGAIDCNDSNGNVNPGRPESCADGVDNNCDGKIDTQDPGCNPQVPCPDPANPTPCGSRCYPAGAVCCDATGGACAAGSQCCGTGCMPADNVCCAPVGYYPAGNTCDYENKSCISGTGVSQLMTHDTQWQPFLEGSNN